MNQETVGLKINSDSEEVSSVEDDEKKLEEHSSEEESKIPEEIQEDEDDDEKITLASWLRDISKNFGGAGKKIRIVFGEDRKTAKMQIIQKGPVPRFSPAGIAEKSLVERAEDIDFDFAVKSDPAIALPISIQLEGDTLKRFQAILRSAPNDQAIPELEFKSGPSIGQVQSNQMFVDWTWQTQKPGRVKEGERMRVSHRLPNLVDYWLNAIEK